MRNDAVVGGNGDGDKLADGSTDGDSLSGADVIIEVDESGSGSGSSSPYAASGYVTSIAIPDEIPRRPVILF